MDERDFQECLRNLRSLKKRSEDFFHAVDIPLHRQKLQDLLQLASQDKFWEDSQNFARVNQEISHLQKKIDPWDRLLNDLGESLELAELAVEEGDHQVITDICSRVDSFERDLASLETIELLADEDDFNNAFVTIHPGAGGTESQDWAQMLLRMYTRWAEKRGSAVEVIDYIPGEEAGIKSVTILVKGDYSFGYLKGENGVHRLVRISPFDANKRRHTSFASVEVIPEVADELDLEIRESDLKIDTYRASGAGGQHVNTTDSAVRITHLPSGIIVQCQNERSQHKNRAAAMKVLKSRLYEQRKYEQECARLEKMVEKKEISWGSQIRSYVFQPYTMVKDHRTGEETGSVDYVFDGAIDRFITAYLKSAKKSPLSI